MFSDRYLEIIQLLVDKAPETLDARDYDQETPLMLAANGSHFEAVKFLIGKGADPNLKNNNS